MITSGVTAASSRDDFLKLLVAQLQHQDPLQPIDQHSFVAELAQFSQLEGIEKLNANFESMLRVQQLAQSVDLVGKEAAYFDSDLSLTTQKGIVDAVTTRQGMIYLLINDRQVPLSLVHSIGLPGGT